MNAALFKIGLARPDFSESKLNTPLLVAELACAILNDPVRPSLSDLEAHLENEIEAPNKALRTRYLNTTFIQQYYNNVHLDGREADDYYWQAAYHFIMDELVNAMDIVHYSLFHGAHVMQTVQGQPIYRLDERGLPELALDGCWYYMTYYMDMAALGLFLDPRGQYANSVQYTTNMPLNRGHFYDIGKL